MRRFNCATDRKIPGLDALADSAVGVATVFLYRPLRVAPRQLRVVQGSPVMIIVLEFITEDRITTDE